MKILSNDHKYMAQALRLAKKGMYTTRSNPRVGCVIVKQDEVIGRGFHAYPGHAHAEIAALNSVHGSAEDSTVYVTLEPCSHHGKTPPCIDSLVNANVKRVVSAMKDPNPLVNGSGLKFLQEHNIATTCDVLNTEAAELNKGFIQRVTVGRPYVTVKSAISLDGKTALRSGESKWISSAEARLDVQKLRARSCVILTGIETVLADDPQMTVRLSKIELGIDSHFLQPKRVILDSQLRIPTNAKILDQAENVIIYTCSENSEKIETLKRLNIEIVQSDNVHERVNLTSVLEDLANREFNEILVESGPTLVGSLLKEKLVDEMIIYMAPHIIGDEGQGLAKFLSIHSMQDRVDLNIKDLRKIGTDIKFQLTPKFT